MNKIHKSTACFLLGSLFLSGLLTIFLPAKSFSSNENRTLQTSVTVSADSFWNGTLQSELASYLSDQFPLRNRLTALGTKLKLISGRKDIGNTYIGKDGYYFEKVTDADINLGMYQNNLTNIETLAAAHPEIKTTVMLVPSSGIVLSDLLPANAAMYDAKSLYQTASETLQSCTVVNPTDALKAQSNRYIYYRTDHHWTSLGAYTAYRALMGNSATAKTYSAADVTDSFLGTLYSRVLDSNAKADTISLPEVSDQVTVTADNAEGSLYDMSALKTKDKYQVYQGGNHGIVEINGTGKGTLLIIKDSFANSFVPYLTGDYAKIVMVDLRYYSGTVHSLIEQENPEQMLVLYELNNFAGDTSVVKLAM